VENRPDAGATSDGVRRDPSRQGGRADATADGSTTVTRTDQTQSTTGGIDVDARHDPGECTNVEGRDASKTVQMTNSQIDRQDGKICGVTNMTDGQSRDLTSIETWPAKSDTAAVISPTGGAGPSVTHADTDEDNDGGAWCSGTLAEEATSGECMGQLRLTQAESDRAAVNNTASGEWRDVSHASTVRVDGHVNALAVDATSVEGKGVEPAANFQAASATDTEQRVAAVCMRSRAAGRQADIVDAETVAERPFTTVHARSKGDRRSTDESGAYWRPTTTARETTFRM